MRAVIFTFDAAQALAFLLQLSETMPLSHLTYFDIYVGGEDKKKHDIADRSEPERRCCTVWRSADCAELDAKSVPVACPDQLEGVDFRQSFAAAKLPHRRDDK